MTIRFVSQQPHCSRRAPRPATSPSLPECERAEAEEFLPLQLLTVYRRLGGSLGSAAIAGLAGRQDDLIGPLAIYAGAAPETVRQIAHATATRIEAVNQFAARMGYAPPAEHLLTHGGDARIKIDPRSGRNSYGSSARPTIGEIGFASSTASCISAHAYASVEGLRRRLRPRQRHSRPSSSGFGARYCCAPAHRRLRARNSS